MKTLTIAAFMILYASSCYAIETGCYAIYDISGKVLKENGEQFNESVTICFKSRYPEEGNGGNCKEYIDYINTSDGMFKWKGKADAAVAITAEKENYISSRVLLYRHLEYDNNAKDITIYMIPKGTPVPLQVTVNAFIPDFNDPEAKGKECGWSFSKRQFFSVDKEDIDMSLSVNEKGQYYYRMKPPGGFVYSGFRFFESDQRRVDGKFEYLVNAPETGYVSDFIQDDHPITNEGWSYCFFKTPKGRYGKIRFKAREFDYYLQPDGSRNLEAGELIDKKFLKEFPKY
jgi:hypothetical protein